MFDFMVNTFYATAGIACLAIAAIILVAAFTAIRKAIKKGTFHNEKN